MLQVATVLERSHQVVIDETLAERDDLDILELLVCNEAVAVPLGLVLFLTNAVLHAGHVLRHKHCVPMLGILINFYFFNIVAGWCLDCTLFVHFDNYIFQC